MVILSPKMAHPHNSGSAVRMFLKFCTMKGANRCIEIILMAFPKKNLVWGKWTTWDPKHPHNSGSTVRIVLQFCTMKGAKRDMEIILTVFLKNISFGAIWSFWSKNGIYVLIALDLVTVFF